MTAVNIACYYKQNSNSSKITTVVIIVYHFINTKTICVQYFVVYKSAYFTVQCTIFTGDLAYSIRDRTMCYIVQGLKYCNGKTIANTS